MILHIMQQPKPCVARFRYSIMKYRGRHCARAAMIDMSIHNLILTVFQDSSWLSCMPFVTGNLPTQLETSSIETFQNHVCCIFCADVLSCFSMLITWKWREVEGSVTVLIHNPTTHIKSWAMPRWKFWSGHLCHPQRQYKVLSWVWVRHHWGYIPNMFLPLGLQGRPCLPVR